ncbi:hypothetical protein [Streptomyces sp. RG80]
MNRTKKVLVTVVLAIAAVGGTAVSASADTPSPNAPVTTDNIHATGVSE